MTEKHAETVRRKDAYHHGDLREALVNATRQLVFDKGAETFTLADACRLAGVSTAAPYKHFRDKDEILQEIIVQGFEQMSSERRAAVGAHPPGSVEGIVAMGHAYIAFARNETAIFRLMFGQIPSLCTAEHVQAHGQACFRGVIEDVARFCATNNVTQDASVLALELWTFVHGAASLAIDGDYDKVAPGLDVEALVTSASSRLLAPRGAI
ncbi:MAG: TetR/AcrR family transcriptional regulator [Hyphomicrobium sp.]